MHFHKPDAYLLDAHIKRDGIMRPKEFRASVDIGFDRLTILQRSKMGGYNIRAKVNVPRTKAGAVSWGRIKKWMRQLAGVTQ